jgi:hypothetical protein
MQGNGSLNSKLIDVYFFLALASDILDYEDPFLTTAVLRGPPPHMPNGGGGIAQLV